VERILGWNVAKYWLAVFGGNESYQVPSHYWSVEKELLQSVINHGSSLTRITMAAAGVPWRNKQTNKN
jgi:hypothetical protein